MGGETSALCRGLAPLGDEADVLQALGRNVSEAVAEGHRATCCFEVFECARCSAWAAQSRLLWLCSEHERR